MDNLLYLSVIGRIAPLELATYIMPTSSFLELKLALDLARLYINLRANIHNLRD